MQEFKMEPIRPATASRAPALHPTITRVPRRPGAIIRLLHSNVPMPQLIAHRPHQPAAAVPTAARAAQVAAVLPTAVRAAVPVAAALPTAAPAVQAAVPADQSAAAQVVVPADQSAAAQVVQVAGVQVAQVAGVLEEVDQDLPGDRRDVKLSFNPRIFRRSWFPTNQTKI